MKSIATLSILFLVLFVSSCKTESAEKTTKAAVSPDQEIANIERQEALLFDAMGEHSDSMATKVMGSYKSFINDNPDHERTPEFLFRSANIARSYKKYDEALSNYKNIVANYPEYENIVESHFLMAFMYDNDYKDKAKAETVYKEVMEKYKGHLFAKQAEERLKTLHLTDDELIKRFKEQNKN